MKDDLHGIFRIATKYFFKKYRDKGGNQRKLAKELGVSQSYISSVLTGARTASLELQGRIAHIPQPVCISVILGGTDVYLEITHHVSEYEAAEHSS